VKRHLIALLGALAVLLAVGSGVAQAQAVQAVGQEAATGQSASADASSTQVNPSNSNISVRIGSPGDNGDVSQSNTSAAVAGALNKAQTTQAAEQSQSGGGGEQAVGQSAGTGQSADADATSKQVNPTNSNISVRIHSPGDNGDVSQSNSSKAGALAGNASKTTQAAEQKQAGGGKCCSGNGVQAVGQEAATIQKADADARSEQYHPSNSNISVRIGSKGDNGSVTQSNDSAAKAIAGNAASTEQLAGQSQGGGDCRCSGDKVQAVGQKAITGQKADADATSIQKGAKNSNVPVRIFSEGDDGDVNQSNTSLAFAGAFNAASTEQAVEQRQRGGCGCRYAMDSKDGKDHGADDGARVQAVGQWAETWQKADADATSKQLYPSNKNAPLRIKSKGDGGDVEQSNASLAAAFSLNLAGTTQWVGQEQ
jgi:GTP cyclohydrolase II